MMGRLRACPFVLSMLGKDDEGIQDNWNCLRPSGDVASREMSPCLTVTKGPKLPLWTPFCSLVNDTYRTCCDDH